MRYYNISMNYREFKAQSTLTGQDYQCRFVYLQTAISLRHSDTVDVKFRVNGEGVVVALPHTAWGEYQERTSKALTDERAARVAAGILKESLERGEAVELLDLNPAADEVVRRAMDNG
jgi:hypothetical protein